MMWVKLTLPPRVRVKWLLRTLRLTSSRRAGTTRKLVAVGTANDASMLTAVRSAAPRSGLPWTAGAAELGGAAATGLAGAAASAPPLVDDGAAGGASSVITAPTGR